MNEALYLVAPVVISFALIPLRRQRPLYWWLIFGGSALLMGLAIVLVGRQGPAVEVVGALILYLLPLVLMFLVLRADVFARRLYLIPLLGPLVYLAGVALSLSIVVTLGILQP